MEGRYFYFTVHSARNLIDVRAFGEMKVYAKVSIAGQSKCTEVDLVNETNPEWNTKLCFFVPEKDIEEGKVDAVIELFCKSLSDDKYVGELNLALAPFYKGECDFEVCRNDSNQSKSFGTLKFSHELGDKVIVVSESLPPSSKDYSEMANIANFGVEARYFYFTVHSAKNLMNVRTFGEMKVYAKVSIAGKSKCTEVDLVNHTNPKWNTKLCFFVPEEDIKRGKIDVVIELFCKRSFSDDKYVGELNLTLAPFYKGECEFQVTRNDSKQSKSFGTLKFSHELGDKVIVFSESLPPSSKDYSEMANIENFGVEARYFYFTIHSAKNLIDVRAFGEMKVYAKVSIAGKSKCTEVDHVNETNPEWNTKLCFFVPEKDIEEGKADAVIELFCKSLSNDIYIGQLNLVLAPFYKGECEFEVCRNDSNQSKSFGTLTFSHELGDKVIVV